jgi:hypothetical protein
MELFQRAIIPYKILGSINGQIHKQIEEVQLWHETSKLPRKLENSPLKFLEMEDTLRHQKGSQVLH